MIPIAYTIVRSALVSVRQLLRTSSGRALPPREQRVLHRALLHPRRHRQLQCALSSSLLHRSRAHTDLTVGAPLAGKYSDYMVVKWRARRNGVWYPEDRLRAATPGLGYLIPLTLIAFGLTTHFVPGPLGLTLNLIWFFLNGIGVRTFIRLVLYFPGADALLCLGRRHPCAHRLVLRRHHARTQR